MLELLGDYASKSTLKTIFVDFLVDISVEVQPMYAKWSVLIPKQNPHDTVCVRKVDSSATFGTPYHLASIKVLEHGLHSPDLMRSATAE